jgi:hypothetical protein
MSDVPDDTLAVKPTRNNDDRLFEFLSRHLGRMLLPMRRGKPGHLLCTELVFFQRRQGNHSNLLDVVKLLEARRADAGRRGIPPYPAPQALRFVSWSERPFPLVQCLPIACRLA